jgi:hypothetical protein
MPITPSRTPVPCSSPYKVLDKSISADENTKTNVAVDEEAIMEDVENIQDGFIHYQLIRFAKPPGCNIWTAIAARQVL